jgi:hypothetical protein
MLVAAAVTFVILTAPAAPIRAQDELRTQAEAAGFRLEVGAGLVQSDYDVGLEAGLGPLDIEAQSDGAVGGSGPLYSAGLWADSVFWRDLSLGLEYLRGRTEGELDLDVSGLGFQGELDADVELETQSETCARTSAPASDTKRPKPARTSSATAAIAQPSGSGVHQARGSAAVRRSTATSTAPNASSSASAIRQSSSASATIPATTRTRRANAATGRRSRAITSPRRTPPVVACRGNRAAGEAVSAERGPVPGRFGVRSAARGGEPPRAAPARQA